MPTIKNATHSALTPMSVTVRPITLALAGLFAVALVVIAIALGGTASGDSSAATPVHVSPSAETPAGPRSIHAPSQGYQP